MVQQWSKVLGALPSSREKNNTKPISGQHPHRGPLEAGSLVCSTDDDDDDVLKP